MQSALPFFFSSTNLQYFLINVLTEHKICWEKMLGRGLNHKPVFSNLTWLINKIFKGVLIIHDSIHRFIGRVARHADVVMPRAESALMDNSCQALCRTLVSQNGLQPENVDISQSVLYTSIMGLLLVTDNEVR